MSINFIGKYRNQDDLPDISTYHYEHIFNIFSVDNADKTFKFYNILSSVKLPELDDDAYEYFRVDSRLPWTAISYRIYGTQHLWWLVVLSNNIFDPTTPPQLGTTLRVINNSIVKDVVEQIKAQF